MDTFRQADELIACNSKMTVICIVKMWFIMWSYFSDMYDMCDIFYSYLFL